MTNCKNCGTDITLNFCPKCGQPAVLKRIDAHYIVHEIEHVLHFERGILYTIRELITTPGKNVKKYIAENRSRLVKPIIFIIITSLIYSIVSHFFSCKRQICELLRIPAFYHGFDISLDPGPLWLRQYHDRIVYRFLG
ncbi:DUF3667 domain-containing protein [Sphingobacterium siyangense]|uniref:DUF3667 domain-containing protein n=1 Tax=Sphingobacterium siyangense TaxID=459529 RepID=UPI002FD94B65